MTARDLKLKSFEDVQKLNHDRQHYFRNEYRNEFDERTDELNDYNTCKTIKVELHGETYYFTMITSGGGSWTHIRNEKDIENIRGDKTIEDDFQLDEQLWIFYQLRYGTWIDLPEHMEIG